MAIPKLQVTLDTAQSRITRDRISTLISAKDWSKRFAENVYIDPITNTAMLTPAPRTEAWATSSAGILRRLSKADYDLTEALWNEGDHLFAGDTYLISNRSDTTEGESVITKAIQPRNGGMYLQWYAANSSAQDWVQVECGWAASNVAVPKASLRIWSSGIVEVYYDDVFEGEYNISGDGYVSQQTASTFTDLCIIPFRKRELLVFSNRGGGFSHIIDSIDDTEDDPTIIPELKFWWRVPFGFAYMQCAPIQYPTSGYVCGIKSILSEIPGGATPTCNVYGDMNGGGAVATLVEHNNPATPFNGLTNECRIKVALTGNGISSPNIYGAHAYYQTEVGQTDDSESVELMDYIVSASLDVPDSPNDIQFSFDIKKPQEVNDTGGIDRFLFQISNRPISVDIGSNPLIDGQTEAPRFVKSYDDTTDRLTIEVRDRWKALEHYTFSDPMPLDGTNLSTAFSMIMEAAGFAEGDLEIEPIDFTLPTVQNPKEGEFSVLVEVGDTAADWIMRLKDSFYSTLFIGWIPRADGVKFVVSKPESLPTTPSVMLYDTVQAAKDYLEGAGGEANLFPRHVIRKYSEQALEPEANDIWVTGRDIRTNRPIQCHKADTASQDPTTAPSLRPENWLGEIRKYGYYEPLITTQEALEHATAIMYERLTPIRIIAEFECDMLFKEDGSPVWRGDAVYIEGGYGAYRILSLSCQFHREPSTTNDWYWRPTRYTAEYMPGIVAPVSLPAPAPAP